MNYNEDDLTLLDLTKNSIDGLQEDQMSQSEVRSISRRYFYMFVFGFFILITLSSLGFSLFQEDTQTQITVLKTKNNVENTIESYKSTIYNIQNTATIVKNQVKAYMVSSDETPSELAYRHDHVSQLLDSAPNFLINGSIYHYIIQKNHSALVIKGDISQIEEKDMQRIYAYLSVSKTINSILDKNKINLAFKRIILASKNLSLIYPLKKADVQSTIINSFNTHIKIFSTYANPITGYSKNNVNFITSTVNKSEAINIEYQQKTHLFNFRYKRNILNKDGSKANIFMDFQEKTPILSNLKENFNSQVVGNVYVVDKNSNVLYSNHLKERNNILFNLSKLTPPVSLNDIQDKKDKKFFTYMKYHIYKEKFNGFGWTFVYMIPDKYWFQFISKTSYLVFIKTFVLGLIYVALVSLFVYLLFVRPSYVLSKLLLAIFDSQQESRVLRNLVQNENKFLLGAWYKWFLKVNRIVYKIVSDYNILYQVMNYDDATHLPNEKHFHNTLKNLSDSLKEDEKLLVAMFTLREFDDIIKIFDITGADAIIQTVAFRLKSLFGISQYKTMARFSLYKFSIALIVDNQLERTQIEDTLAEIMTNIVSTISIKGQSIKLNPVLVYTEIHRPHHLDDHLELALVKFLNDTYSNGESLQRYTTAQNISLQNNMILYNKLHDSVINKDMTYHYQPQIDTKTGQIVGIEAFMRWRFQGKIIPPSVFIPFINNTGILSSMTLKLIETALDDLKTFMKLSNNPDLIMSINLSTRQALNSTFINKLSDVIQKNGIPFANIGLEVTEDVLSPNESLKYTSLKALQNKGVHVRVSNFGATSLSITELSDKQYNECKITRDIIKKFRTDQGKSHFNIISNVIKDMDMDTVVVEGVQDIDTIVEIQSAGFNIMQSYFLCPPMPLGELSARIEKGFRKV